MFRLAVFRRRLRAEYLVSALVRLLPDSGNVMSRSRGCLAILREWDYGASPTVETGGRRGWRPRLIRLPARLPGRRVRQAGLRAHERREYQRCQDNSRGDKVSAGCPSKLRLNKYSTLPMLKHGANPFHGLAFVCGSS